MNEEALAIAKPFLSQTAKHSQVGSSFVLTAQFVLKESHFHPSLTDFEHAVLNVNAYPRTGRYLGFPIDLFEKSIILKPATHPGDECVIYQKTGSSEMFNVTARHYVLKLWNSEKNKSRTRIEWSLCNHVFENGRFQGEFASVLNASQENTIYTPDNSGYWEYDRSSRTINFGITIDIGIPVSHPKLLQKLLTVLPLTLMRERWQIEDFEKFVMV